ncbi:hypothetical protein [Streptomyces sp. NPDC059009]|uniref:hypothetical protein n=1 Tax=Streptomyces sp. NPDC059009 TaxID=3346694 RepID=UPI0036741404
MSGTDVSGIHVSVTRTATPKDHFGRPASPSGRALLTALGRGRPSRCPDGRWHWPASDWRGSVSHTGAVGAAAMAEGSWIGVDIQEDRQRPAALRWLATVVGAPVGIREWAEVEALLKAQGRAGSRPTRVPLPPWRPGWRAAGDGWWVRSSRIEPCLHLAVAAEGPLPVRGEGAVVGGGVVDGAAIDRAVVGGGAVGGWAADRVAVGGGAVEGAVVGRAAMNRAVVGGGALGRGAMDRAVSGRGAIEGAVVDRAVVDRAGRW